MTNTGAVLWEYLNCDTDTGTDRFHFPPLPSLTEMQTNFGNLSAGYQHDWVYCGSR